jgi:hypothetical protein
MYSEMRLLSTPLPSIDLVFFGVEGGRVVLEILDQRAGLGAFVQDLGLAFVNAAAALGTWTAEQIGLSGAEAEAYAKSVVAADFEEAGDDDVFRKVRGDLDAKGKQSISDADIRAKMSALLAEAAAEIKAGK